MTRLYLFTYNFLCLVLWSCFLIRIAVGVHDYYEDTFYLLATAQTLALLELVHSATGLVRSPLVSTTLQVFSRIGMLWAIAFPFDKVHDSSAFKLMTIAWGLVEVPRYAFYAVNLYGKVPYALKWMRYSFFIVLYPMGISGELWCLYKSFDQVPFFWAVVVAALLYIPGSPFLYMHMVKQRKKNLSLAKNKLN